MSLHKLTAGDGYTYLTRQVAAADATERGYTSLGDYYAAKGESPGRWIGLGLTGLADAGAGFAVSGKVTEQQMKNLFGAGIHPNADQIATTLVAAGHSPAAAKAAGRLGSPFYQMQMKSGWRDALTDGYRTFAVQHGLGADEALSDEDKQTVRTQVANQLFQQIHHRLPVSAAERTGFIAQQSRPDRTAIAGYDVTFSPVKSVSTLWAVASRPVAEKIDAAHHAAVRRTLEWIEREAGYTRLGARGVAQVPTRGLIMAMFTHRDSRAGDPDLHTHVAISNKVQTLDERWLALDARMLYRITVGASEFYNTHLEAEVVRRVGVTFADQPAEPGKRPVREIVGIDPRLNQRWSTRRAAITTHRTHLAKTFLAQHGRLPTTVEMIKLAQQATLATRHAKHQPGSLAEQRHAWHHEAVHLLGGDAQLARMLRTVHRRIPEQATPEVNDQFVQQLAASVVETVSESRATWRQTNLDAEALRQVRRNHLHPDQCSEVASLVAARAAEQSLPIGPDPEIPGVPVPTELIRPVDGMSVFRVAKGQLFTGRYIVDAEARILAAAGRTGARTLTAQRVQLAHLEWSANHHGAMLNTAQATMVTDIGTDDRIVQLALAPAGTGKTTVMGVLAGAWLSSGGNVLGLAPQACAAQELAAALPGVEADTVDKLVHDLQHVDSAKWQPWMTRIDQETLVIIDEAGLASTPKLDAAIQFIADRGGRVLLVGDDQQRTAPSAGGILRNIETTHGATTLTEVLRFTDPTEGQASLALRAGDPGVIGYYTDRNRITAVTPDTAATTVFQAWAADIKAGAESIMIAPTLDMVRNLNTQARAARLAREIDQSGPERTLPNGETISAGDTIITKQNKRTLSLGGTDFVRNNQRWKVDQVHPDGSITATETSRNVTRLLPAWYLNNGWVRLGYAHTHASVQGLTIGKAGTRPGTAHAVITPGMTRNDLYPALTRAVDGTTTYVILGGDGDPHDVITPDAIQPPTAAEILQRIITTDGAARSTTTEQAEAADPVLRLGPAADTYAYSVVVGAETVIGPDRLAAITQQAEVAVPGITSAFAWEVLRGHLTVIAADGRDPIQALTDAAQSRELDTARDIAAVLDYRLDPTGNHSQRSGPLPWLPHPPAAVRALPGWSNYLSARAHLVEQLSIKIQEVSRAWHSGSAPTWAIPYLSDPHLVADLAVWRAAESVPDTDLRPAGPTPRRIAMIQRHADLVKTAIQVGGDSRDSTDRWTTALGAESASIMSDDYWPVLSARLNLADTAGINVATLLRAVTADQPPLPTEGAAGALWWRLAPHVGDLTAITSHGHRLRPPWTQHLETVLGSRTTEILTRDRLWPVIVARVDAATRNGADPADLVTDAAQMLNATRSTLADHELPTVLMVTITTLTDPSPADPDDDLPPDPADEDLHAPHDAHRTLAADDELVRLADVTAGGGHSVALMEPPDVDPDELDDPLLVAFHPVPTNISEIPLPAERLEPREQNEPADSRSSHGPPARSHSPNSESSRLSTPTSTKEQVDPRTVERLKAALTAAHSFYTDNAAHSWVPTYLTDRGLDPAAAGYAPGRTATVDHLRQHGFTDPEILAAGLARTNGNGQLYDFFRNRATLPYTNPDGQVIGFLARKPAADSNPANPKYINSPGTVLFDKARTPFGLDPAAAAALQHGADLIIVEGPTDAIAINTATDRCGTVALATGGTALTAGHLAAVDRVASLADLQVVVMMDNDAAGRAAAVKAFALLTDAGITHPATVMPLPEKDPAELLQQRGPDALRRALGERRPMQDLVVDQILRQWPNPHQWIELRIQALRDVAPAVAQMPANEQDRQILRVAETLNLTTINVLDAVDRHVCPPAPYVYNPDNGLDLPTPPALLTGDGAPGRTTPGAIGAEHLGLVAEKPSAVDAATRETGSALPADHLEEDAETDRSQLDEVSIEAPNVNDTWEAARRDWDVAQPEEGGIER